MTDKAQFEVVLVALCTGTKLPKEFAWVAQLDTHDKIYFACELSLALAGLDFVNRVRGEPAYWRRKLERVAELVMEWKSAALL